MTDSATCVSLCTRLSNRRSEVNRKTKRGTTATRNRAKAKAWRDANPDKVQAYEERRAEKKRAYTRAWNAAHKEQRLSYWREYYRTHPERRAYYNERGKARRRQREHALRLRVLAHYGSVCACCQESTLEFLTIDHIEGGGVQHRKGIPSGNIYRWLEANGYPAGFRVLCMNCNWATRWEETCPHQRDTSAKRQNSPRRKPVESS